MLEEGIGEVTGDPKTKEVKVAYRSEAITPEQIETALAGIGYRPQRAQHASA